MSVEDDEYELRRIIAEMEMDHRRHMEPFYKQLAKYVAMKPPAPIMVYIPSGNISFEDGNE